MIITSNNHAPCSFASPDVDEDMVTAEIVKNQAPIYAHPSMQERGDKRDLLYVVGCRSSLISFP